MLKVNRKGEYQSYSPGVAFVFVASLGYLLYTVYRTFPFAFRFLPF